jgi:hypothetical protein
LGFYPVDGEGQDKCLNLATFEKKRNVQRTDFNIEKRNPKHKGRHKASKGQKRSNLLRAKSSSCIDKERKNQIQQGRNGAKRSNPRLDQSVSGIGGYPLPNLRATTLLKLFERKSKLF